MVLKHVWNMSIFWKCLSLFISSENQHRLSSTKSASRQLRTRKDVFLFTGSCNTDGYGQSVDCGWWRHRSTSTEGLPCAPCRLVSHRCNNPNLCVESPRKGNNSRKGCPGDIKCNHCSTPFLPFVHTTQSVSSNFCCLHSGTKQFAIMTLFVRLSHSYSRRLPALGWISSLWHSEHWAEITLRQHHFLAIAMLCFN